MLVVVSRERVPGDTDTPVYRKCGMAAVQLLCAAARGGVRLVDPVNSLTIQADTAICSAYLDVC